MIKLIKSTFYHEAETKQALADFILNEEILSMGPYCKKFEEMFAAKQERAYAVFVSNGSVANLLLVQALLNSGKLKKGSRIGFSALTWPTNVMPLLQLGLTPVALDCSLETLNVSPQTLQTEIDTLDAVFLTNVLGFSDDIEEIRTLCEGGNILLFEDNCESLGSKTGGKLLGNFGIASTFSFFVGHHMSTIEGGMVCTDDRKLYEQMVMARAHGWDRNLSPETQTKLRNKHNIDDFYAKYTFYDIASNFRASELNGFVGTLQVGYWDEIVSKREANFKKFNEALSRNPDFYAYDLKHMDIVSNFSMPVICKTPGLAQQYRDKFVRANVEIRPVIAGDMTKQPFYKKYVSDAQECPNSSLVHENGFYFGNNPEMTSKEIDQLCALLEK